MDSDNKEPLYKCICGQLAELMEATEDTVSRMATVSAVLFSQLDYVSWVGFYRLIDDELIVGPFQGPVACLKLRKDVGVCWAAVNRGETVRVVDVTKFDGHIACDCNTRSEIVIPCRDETGGISAVLDLDSYAYGAFDEIDAEYLEKTVGMFAGNDG